MTNYQPFSSAAEEAAVLIRTQGLRLQELGAETVLASPKSGNNLELIVWELFKAADWLESPENKEGNPA